MRVLCMITSHRVHQIFWNFKFLILPSNIWNYCYVQFIMNRELYLYTQTIVHVYTWQFCVEKCFDSNFDRNIIDTSTTHKFDSNTCLLTARILINQLTHISSKNYTLYTEQYIQKTTKWVMAPTTLFRRPKDWNLSNW